MLLGYQNSSRSGNPLQFCGLLGVHARVASSGAVGRHACVENRRKTSLRDIGPLADALSDTSAALPPDAHSCAPGTSRPRLGASWGTLPASEGLQRARMRWKGFGKTPAFRYTLACVRRDTPHARAGARAFEGHPRQPLPSGGRSLLTQNNAVVRHLDASGAAPSPARAPRTGDRQTTRLAGTGAGRVPRRRCPWTGTHPHIGMKRSVGQGCGVFMTDFCHENSLPLGDKRRQETTPI